MIPTRNEIQAKITQIRNDPTWSTIDSDLVQRVSDWLVSIGCPTEDREKILDDLKSYQ